MRFPVLLLALAALAAAAPAAAQARTEMRFATAPRAEVAPPALLADTLPAAGDAAVRRESRGGHVAGRSAFGALGWFGGAAAGALVGMALVNSDGGGEDWEDLTGLVLGAALGSTAGSGVGAALPRYGSRCGFGKRVGNGMLGSLAGTLVAATVANATHENGAAIIIPIGSSVGAALAVGC
ncbi:hypothetical protein [Longimicrobium sp.]|uniref:hypothetical protein n=1 Tax=Longimicrobium sp. TaxID=2029185 RepID=UPI002C1D6471|nr:hypothetical protein [Longimicrobium sp.]HSU13825.1 hypothetical protein [Longimicrobium sp.]